MKHFIKNIILLAIALVASYFTAEFFGGIYDYFVPQYDNTLGVGKDMLKFIVGIPLAYIFFTILLFKLFGTGNKKHWLIWLMIPPLLFFGSSDLRHIYLPILLGLISFGLALLLRLTILPHNKHN